ncbi:MAG: hypothetical protein BWX98_02500 [Candidatus Aminicenantes bacterium ADurb.Bin147]|nr:MAG: hypothetical protein BWX98_02500 [Candidatus Aminicenantes bacterium ADurb.Bin147]
MAGSARGRGSFPERGRVLRRGNHESRLFPRPLVRHGRIQPCPRGFQPDLRPLGRRPRPRGSRQHRPGGRAPLRQDPSGRENLVPDFLQIRHDPGDRFVHELFPCPDARAARPGPGGGLVHGHYGSRILPRVRSPTPRLPPDLFRKSRDRRTFLGFFPLWSRARRPARPADAGASQRGPGSGRNLPPPPGRGKSRSEPGDHPGDAGPGRPGQGGFPDVRRPPRFRGVGGTAPGRKHGKRRPGDPADRPADGRLGHPTGRRPPDGCHRAGRRHGLGRIRESSPGTRRAGDFHDPRGPHRDRGAILPLGIRHGRRRGRFGDQSLRSAERRALQEENGSGLEYLYEKPDVSGRILHLGGRNPRLLRGKTGSRTPIRASNAV